MLRVDVDLDMGGVPVEARPAVLDSLACSWGLTDMLKAHQHPDGEGDDLRFPELFRLIRLARADWLRWGTKLVDSVLELHRDRRLFPLTAANEEALVRLFEDHELAMLIRFARPPSIDLQRRKRLEAAGLLDPDLPGTSWVELAYRIGRRLETLVKPEEREVSEASLAKLVRDTFGPGRTGRLGRQLPRLTPQQTAALEYVRRRSAHYMRVPATKWTGSLYVVISEEERHLRQAELAAVRGALGRAVAEGSSDRELERKLRAAVKGTRLTNDMMRVARTELVNAHSQGAYSRLLEQAHSMGIDRSDIRVYKIVSRTACEHCRRIWGPPDDPIIYKLSTIEAWEAKGGNFQIPAKQWRAVVGPVHPNCTEGGLLLYVKRIARGALAAARRVAAAIGRRR